MQNPLKQIVKAQKEGRAVGIYSCCSANEYVIRAALLKGKKDQSCVLIESTANQCDQYGGYTGMKPADFKAFVEGIANEIGFDTNKLFLGGDHLGPLTFTSLNEEEAMKEAEELIRCYVAAGFTKIHIDTSMRVADDDVNERLSDETIARRGARLAKVAEETYAKLKEENPDAIEPVYIVGSEVPIPGGAQGAVDEGVQVTKPEDFKATLATFEKAFKDNGLDHAWSNVIGIVVQPGVEEKDSGCTEYDREKAVDLCAAIRDYDNIVFEGHSTDYQTKIKLREMVEDGIAILKVGPGFTFMMRQALFALADIENELFGDKASHFKEVLDQAMLADPKYWSKHYIGTEEEVAMKRKYSFSDRCRYYMPVPSVQEAMHTMINNLRTHGIPLNLLTQYMPIQYTRVREGLLENDPEALIVDRICDSIDEYLYATHQSELF
ncbi:class II D-tagatose-bisphosphate aldolase, non-catalytic subunit [Floccifex sp.]|uniref:class II D-tagatose-bisphosphate aldolase, non-catalytic subunit n=1 Tax=Floccifex sp. TaxID=2815810 RepID=UPI002A74E0EC|nr:class II D-tagatose-bisphosphate aldolase, non-catalytic subunit [Floccifex sp.]MDD7282156.1 class II D-tagatose-bisphosphate aldolase, non-catalytic subunit [Erysipelotrichaceae bacterium]MDY2959049.1 class II D-tagatose-bisphosphate aldolase, non-catalytic subunit [Floccifex sp.]